jgi:hypothetical protein
VRRDLEETLRAALADADFHRKLIPLIVDVVEGVLDCTRLRGQWPAAAGTEPGQ